MTALGALVLGAGIGVGVVLIGCGVLGRPVLGSMPVAHLGLSSPRVLLATALAVAAGVAAFGLTHWVVGGVLAALAVVAAPRLFGGRTDHRREIALVEAIATWTEMLRDTIAAAAGLEQAIGATGPIAPAPIAEAVGLLTMRLDFEPMPAALRAFADDVSHPACDFVVAALVIAAEKEARELGPLLGQLADCARDEARMRTRVWIDRAKTRTSVKVIAGCVVAFAVGLLAFSRPYLEPYDSASGQLVLVLIAALFVGSLVGMDRMGHIAMPERFVSRRSS